MVPNKQKDSEMFRQLAADAFAITQEGGCFGAPEIGKRGDYGLE